MSHPFPLVSVVTYLPGKAALTLPLLRSLARVPYPHLEVVVVGHLPQHGQAERLQAALAGVRLLFSPQDRCPVQALNAGILAAQGSYIFLVAPGSVVSAEAVSSLVRALEAHPEASGACPMVQVLGPTNLPAYASPPRPMGPPAYLQAEEDWGTEAAINVAGLLVRRSVFDSTGLLRAAPVQGYEIEGVARALRAAGHEIRYVRDAVMWHREVVTVVPPDSAPFFERPFQMWGQEARHAAKAAWASVEHAFSEVALASFGQPMRLRTGGVA